MAKVRVDYRDDIRQVVLDDKFNETANLHFINGGNGLVLIASGENLMGEVDEVRLWVDKATMVDLLLGLTSLTKQLRDA